MQWRAFVRLGLVGLAVVVGATLASVRFVPDTNVLAVRWLVGDTARLRGPGLVLAPRLLTRSELFPADAKGTHVSGSTAATTREGVAVALRWEGVLRGKVVPTGSSGVAARLASAATAAATQVASRLGAEALASQPALELRSLVVTTSPEWSVSLASLTAYATLSADAQRAGRLAALRDRFAQAGRQVAVIGWDGADWQLLDRLVASGRLPNLAALVARGATADLQVPQPLVSPVIWTSIATGVTAEVHGIFDFLRPSAGGTGTEPITSFDRKVPALWNIASGLGRPVGIVAWWASWPAEPVDGFVVSDRVAYQLSGYTSGPEQEGLFYPADAASWLLPLSRDEDDVSDAEISRYIEAPPGALTTALAAGRGFGDPVVHLARLLASTDTYHRMTLAAWQRYRSQLLFAYIEGTDTIGHLFGPYTPPRRAHIAEADVRRFGHAVDAYYVHADALLGELLEALGPDTTVVLCSDHGFTWGDDRPRESSSTHTPTAAWWHRPVGVLLLAGPGVRHVTRRGSAQVLDLAPTVAALAGLPPGDAWPGKVLDWALAADVVPAGEPVDWGALLPPAVRIEAAKDDPNAREYLARLQALGYIAGSAEVGGTPAAAPTPAETLLAVMNRGTVLLEKGDIQGALVAYRSATDMAPGFAGAWLRLATPQRHLGDLEGALVSYRRAYSVAREDSHRESALLGQGIVLDQLDRTGEALNVLRNGVEELPESFILWNTLGGLLLKSREREEARQALERATALREDPDTLNSLAALELALGGDPAKARRLWQRSLELRPGQQDVERALRELQR